jgi:hypothetical protein
MRAVEVGTGVWSTKLVAEIRFALYGALCNHRDSVHVRSSSLEQPVPVKGRLQAGQVALHVHGDSVALANLQPHESQSILLTQYNPLLT